MDKIEEDLVDMIDNLTAERFANQDLDGMHSCNTKKNSSANGRRGNNNLKKGESCEILMIID